MKKCSVEICSNLAIRREWCSAHYRRILKNSKLTKAIGLYTGLKDKFDRCYEIVTESGCWIWLLSTDFSGYGRMQHKTIRRVAHKVSFELYKGKVPEGLCVLHKCDVRCCVNPDHLFLGTRTDNNLDAFKKGRTKLKNWMKTAYP